MGQHRPEFPDLHPQPRRGGALVWMLLADLLGVIALFGLIWALLVAAPIVDTPKPMTEGVQHD